MKRREPARLIAMGLCAMAASSPAAGKDGYSLTRPTPDHLLRDMSTDRPDKTESPHTVDAGRMQIEMDLVAYTHDRDRGVTTETVDIMPFNLKIGLTDATDLQVVYCAFSHMRTSGGGNTDTERGFNDLTLRAKHNLWGNDGGRTAFAIMPFVKLPTNNLAGLNDDIEGGIIMPFAIDIGGGVGIGLMTEIDILRAENGSGYEPTFVNSATMSFELTDSLGMYVEAFLERSTESGAETIVTLDGGFTYAMTENIQLDVGANVGVTDAADDLNVFVGMSRRY